MSASQAAGPAGLTRTAFARELGVSKSYITKLAQAGRLVLTADGLVDGAASKQRIQATAGAPERMAEPAPVFADARDKREHYQAEMARLDYETRCGTLMDAADVRSAVANAATTLRTRLELLPDQLAPQLAAQPDESAVRAMLANEIEALLADLAAHFAGLQRAGTQAPPAGSH